MAVSELLHSPALHLGQIEVLEKPGRKRGRFRGTVAKRWLTRVLRSATLHLPEPMTRGVLRGIGSVLQVGAPLPGNQLLESCRVMSRLAERAGSRHAPGAMYRAFLDGTRGVLESCLRVYHGRADEAAGQIHIPHPKRISDLVEAHGGCMLCVPHNTGAVFAALKLNRLFPTVLLAKNPPSIERTRAALWAYEHLGVKVLMVRGGNPFELSRACLRALREGQVVVATVDRIDRSEGRVLVPMFGGRASLAPWPARIAAKAGVPVVPTYAHARRGRVDVAFGAPLVSAEPDTLLRHYVHWLEAKIIEDPASWSFLADRRWRWVLQDAAAGTQHSQGGVLRPGKSNPDIPPARVL